MEPINKKKFDQFRKYAGMADEIDKRIHHILKVMNGKEVIWEYNINPLCNPVEAYLLNYIYVRAKEGEEKLYFPYPLSVIGGIPDRWLWQDFEKEFEEWKRRDLGKKSQAIYDDFGFKN